MGFNSRKPSKQFIDYCRYLMEQRRVIHQEVIRLSRENGTDVKTTYGIQSLAGVLHFGFGMDMGSALASAERKYSSSN